MWLTVEFVGVSACNISQVCSIWYSILHTYGIKWRLRGKEECKELGVAACGLAMAMTSLWSSVAVTTSPLGFTEQLMSYIPINAHQLFSENIRGRSSHRCSSHSCNHWSKFWPVLSGLAVDYTYADYVEISGLWTCIDCIHILPFDPIIYGRVRSDSTPFLAHGVKMHGCSCAYGSYWSDLPLEFVLCRNNFWSTGNMDVMYGMYEFCSLVVPILTHILITFVCPSDLSAGRGGGGGWSDSFQGITSNCIL